uniref:Uncharacterized protein n=1 Tax=Tetraselmis sp. GSL018 TaxID=582737 RepID=A0A061S3I6_9CHLO
MAREEAAAAAEPQEAGGGGGTSPRAEVPESPQREKPPASKGRPPGAEKSVSFRGDEELRVEGSLLELYEEHSRSDESCATDVDVDMSDMINADREFCLKEVARLRRRLLQIQRTQTLTRSRSVLPRVSLLEGRGDSSDWGSTSKEDV